MYEQKLLENVKKTDSKCIIFLCFTVWLTLKIILAIAG